MKRKRRTVSHTSDSNLLGKRYAEILRERAAVLRSSFLISRKGRDQMAEDLEALAQIAETDPQVFQRVK